MATDALTITVPRVTAGASIVGRVADAAEMLWVVVLCVACAVLNRKPSVDVA